MKTYVQSEHADTLIRGQTSVDMSISLKTGLRLGQWMRKKRNDPFRSDYILLIIQYFLNINSMNVNIGLCHRFNRKVCYLSEP